jgi:DNA-binding HxlR family transcriptional regulator
VARASAPLFALLQKLELQGVGLKKWCMPVMAALSAGSQRFSELRAAFPSATARALALALKDLEAAGLIARSVVESYPPTTRYEPTSAGHRFAAILRPLGKSYLKVRAEL